MKFLIILLLTVCSLSTQARGPGDGPIVPWPTTVGLERLTCEELQGNWTAYSHNTIWFLELYMDSTEGALSTLRIRSNALFNNKGNGWLEYDGRLFFGKLVLDHTHIYDIFLFKDRDGTKLRIAQGPLKYYDLKLYRKE